MMDLKLLALVPFLLMSTSFSNAEYEFHTQVTFEENGGKLPETFRHGLSSSPFTTRVVSLPEINFGSMMTHKDTSSILGEYGLEFFPIAEDPHLSSIDSRFFDREELDKNGAALIQVDFFFPSETGNRPTMAILANGAPDGVDMRYRFYRFGIDRDRAYFSFTNKGSTPEIYLRQSLSEFDIKMNSWHRLQMQFNGDDTIVCAIDGQVTSFSPITEGSITKLEPGIMVTRGRMGEDHPVYADNLGVWKTENSHDLPPRSPWVEEDLDMSSFQSLHLKNWTLNEIIEWTTSPSEAWKQAEEEEKLIFALFHSNDPDIKESIMNKLQSDDAISVISKCIPLRVDVSESAGKFLASRFGLSTFPSIVILSENGTSINNFPINNDYEIPWHGILENSN